MASRLDLQKKLLAIADRVYFQPPETLKLVYPCIVYERQYIRNDHADNSVYASATSYSVTVIDPDPDSSIVTAVASLPSCRFDRHFVSENLNHDTFVIYNL